MKNREIKFRAWDKKGNKFVNTVSTKLFIQLFGDIVTIQDDSTLAEVNDEFILMQYTGLKDVNGKEIYEGDIDNKGRECKYFEKLSAFGFISKNHAAITFVGQMVQNGGFIIGNIHENPELLK